MTLTKSVLGYVAAAMAVYLEPCDVVTLRVTACNMICLSVHDAVTGLGDEHLFMPDLTADAAWSETEAFFKGLGRELPR